MKRFSLRLSSLLFILALAGTIFSAAAQDTRRRGEVLTNDSVIEMARAGLSTEIILDKIAASSNSFDVSTGGLVRLKKEGVPDQIIKAMMSAAKQNSIPEYRERSDEGPPRRSEPTRNVARGIPLSSNGYPQEPGVYLLETVEGTRRAVKLEPRAYSQNLVRTQTQGEKGPSKWSILLPPSNSPRPHSTSSEPKEKWRTAFEGEHAEMEVGTRPVFLFVIRDTYPAGDVLKDVFLLRLTVKDGAREFLGKKDNPFEPLQIGGNLFAPSGSGANDVMQFEYEEVASGVVKVTLKYGLAAGEYGFFHRAGRSSSSLFAGLKGYDFRIKIAGGLVPRF